MPVLSCRLRLSSGRKTNVIPLHLSPLKFTANRATSLVLPLPLAPVGVWVGVRMARTISPLWFYRILYGGMFLTGVKLLCDGLA